MDTIIRVNPKDRGYCRWPFYKHGPEVNMAHNQIIHRQRDFWALLTSLSRGWYHRKTKRKRTFKWSWSFLVSSPSVVVIYKAIPRENHLIIKNDGLDSGGSTQPSNLAIRVLSHGEMPKTDGDETSPSRWVGICEYTIRRNSTLIHYFFLLSGICAYLSRPLAVHKMINITQRKVTQWTPRLPNFLFLETI